MYSKRKKRPKQSENMKHADVLNDSKLPAKENRANETSKTAKTRKFLNRNIKKSGK